MAKTLIDYISEEDFPRYKELVEKATAAKAAAPKKSTFSSLKGKTLEEKKAYAEAKLAELNALLAKLEGEETT